MEAKLKKGKNIDHQGLTTIPNICHLPGPPILSHWSLPLMLFFFLSFVTLSVNQQNSAQRKMLKNEEKN
jgi:hypothetical protein